MAFNRNLGMTLLAIYLIIQGLALVIGLSFQGLPIVLGALALASGICLLMGK